LIPDPGPVNASDPEEAVAIPLGVGEGEDPLPVLASGTEDVAVVVVEVVAALRVVEVVVVGVVVKGFGVVIASQVDPPSVVETASPSVRVVFDPTAKQVDAVGHAIPCKPETVDGTLCEDHVAPPSVVARTSACLNPTA
jgi:hypothetical protein